MEKQKDEFDEVETAINDISIRILYTSNALIDLTENLGKVKKEPNRFVGKLLGLKKEAKELMKLIDDSINTIKIG